MESYYEIRNIDYIRIIDLLKITSRTFTSTVLFNVQVKTESDNRAESFFNDFFKLTVFQLPRVTIKLKSHIQL